jgi:hypothetical protein
MNDDYLRHLIDIINGRTLAHRLNIAYCEACGYAHGREHTACELHGYTFGGSVEFIGESTTTRIPDNDLSVCMLHPGRKLAAHRLLESIEGLDLDL